MSSGDDLRALIGQVVNQIPHLVCSTRMQVDLWFFKADDEPTFIVTFASFQPLLPKPQQAKHRSANHAGTLVGNACADVAGHFDCERRDERIWAREISSGVNTGLRKDSTEDGIQFGHHLAKL